MPLGHHEKVRLLVQTSVNYIYSTAASYCVDRLQTIARSMTCNEIHKYEVDASLKYI